MSMNLLRKKWFAQVVMVLCILTGTLLGSYRSLTSAKAAVEKQFYEGVDHDGFSIQHDLEERINLAHNLITIAGKYQVDGNKVYQARQALQEASTISQKYAANVALSETTHELYRALKDQSMEPKDEDYRERINADLLSRNSTISHDGYNAKAATLNQTFRQFPANVLRGLLRITEAELFYQGKE